MALGVAAAVGDHDRDDGRDALLRDQVVEDAAEPEVGLAQAGAVMRHEQGRGRARYVLRGDMHRDGALVVDGVGLDDEGLRVLRVGRAELLAGDAGVEALAVLRIHLELLDLALRHAGDGLRFRRGGVVGTDHVVAVDVHRRRRTGLAVEAEERRRARGIERTRRRLGAGGRLGRRGRGGLGGVGGEACEGPGEQAKEQGSGAKHGG